MANQPNNSGSGRAEQDLARSLRGLPPEVLQDLQQLPPEFLTTLGQLSPEALESLARLPLSVLNRLTQLSATSLEWLGRTGAKLAAVGPDALAKLSQLCKQRPDALRQIKELPPEVVRAVASLPQDVVGSLVDLPVDLLRELPSALRASSETMSELPPGQPGRPDEGSAERVASTLDQLSAESLATLAEMPAASIATISAMEPSVLATLAELPTEVFETLSELPPEALTTILEAPLGAMETLSELDPRTMSAITGTQPGEPESSAVPKAVYVQIGRLGTGGKRVLGNMLSEARSMRDIQRQADQSAHDAPHESVDDQRATVDEITLISARKGDDDYQDTASAETMDEALGSGDWSEGLSAFEESSDERASKPRSETESADFSEAIDPEGVSDDTHDSQVAQSGEVSATDSAVTSSSRQDSDDDSYGQTMQSDGSFKDDDESYSQTVQSDDSLVSDDDDSYSQTVQSDEISDSSGGTPFENSDSYSQTMQSGSNYSADGLSALDEPSDNESSSSDRTIRSREMAKPMDDDSYGQTVASDSFSGDPDDSFGQTMQSDDSAALSADDSYSATMQSDSGTDESFAQTLASADLPREAKRDMMTAWGDDVAHHRPGMTIKGAGPQREHLANLPKNTLVIRPRHLGTRQIPDFNKDRRVPEPTDPEYELLKVLGEGGMGIVFTARQRSIDREVALKMLKAKTAKDKEQRDKFLTEAVVTGDLDHPNIVPIYDVGLSADNALFYSMKKVQGTPWLKVLKEKPLGENLEILQRVADAVAFAHERGVIHRDLKPENIMLGEFGVVLVMDWGLAYSTKEFSKSGSITANTSMGGTPAYMAPEMATGPISKIGPHSDVYLLGAMLFEIITGKPPHAGKNAMKCLMAAARNEIRDVDQERTLKLDPTGELLAIAKRAMASDPKERQPSVLEFQKEIRDYEAHREKVGLSVSLCVRAREDLGKAKQLSDYQEFAKSLFGFQEAVAMWDGNAEAKAGVIEAKFAYAETAQRKGDLDLGMSLLDVSIPAHKDLYDELKFEAHEREARKAAIQRYKKVGLAAAVVFMVTVSGAAFWIDAARREANTQREIAVEERQEAKRQEGIAKEQEQLAKINEAEAVKQKAIAETNEANAIKARKEAERQTLLAEESAKKEREQKEIATMERMKAEKQEMLALANEKKAKEQEAKATEQKLLAEKNADEAKKQEKLANAAAEEARKQAKLAKDNEAEAVKQRTIAEKNETEANRQKEIAKKSEAEAIKQQNIAVEQRKIADEQRLIAETKRKEAEVAKEQEEYQAYIARIGLADAKIRENAFEAAIGILNDCPPRLRNWEWGRLMHLCSLSIGSFDNGAPVDAIALSPNGSMFVTGGWNGEAVVWDSTSGKALQRLKHGLKPEGIYVHAVDWSRDGKWIVTGSNDEANGYVQLWNAETGERVNRTFGRGDTAHQDAVLSVQFSNDGSRLLTGSYDSTARLWDVATGNQLKQFAEHTSWVWDAKFSPKEDKIVTASQDGRAIIWELETAQPGPPFTGHTGPVYSAAFSSDGFLIATGGYDKRVLVWKPADVRPYDFRRLTSPDGNVIRSPKFVALDGHSAPVRSVQFSRDSRLIVSGSMDNTVRLWSTEAGQVVKHFRGHDGAVRAAIFADSDQTVLSASSDNRIKKWNISQYEEVRTLQSVVLDGHYDAILSADFSPTGQQVVTASRDRTARTWDALSGKELKMFSEGHAFLTSAAVFFPDGKRMATAAVDNTVRIWDVDAGTQLAMLEHTGRAAALGISADGKWLITGSDDRSAKIWDATSGELKYVLTDHRNEVTAVGFSPDGRLAVTGDSRGRAAIWDIKTQKVLHELNGHARVRITDAAFLDNTRVLTASADKTVAQWNATTGKEEAGLILKHPDRVVSMAVVPKKRQIITACGDQKVRVWNVDSAQIVGTWNSQTEINSVAANAAGDWALAVDANNRNIHLWKLSGAEQIVPDRTVETRGLLWTATFAPSKAGTMLLTLGGSDARIISSETKEVQMTFSPHGVVASASYSPRGDRIVTGSWDFSARIWNAATGADELKLGGDDGHTGIVHSAVFSPDLDGKWVLTASGDGTAKLWDSRTGKVLKTLSGHSDQVRHAAFSSDGTRVITTSNDKTARIWDLATGETVVTLEGHQWSVLFGSFSKSGKQVITASDDNTSRIWDVETGKTLRELSGHTASVTSVAFAPVVTGADADQEPTRAVTASADGTVKLWDTTTQTEILTLDGHTREVTSVTFSPDGKYVLTGSQDGRAILWLATDWNENQSNEEKKVAAGRR